MKKTVFMLTYLVTFLTVYMLVSSVGMLFFKGDGTHYTFAECAGDKSWFIIYSLFLGWWGAAIPAMEAYELMERKELMRNTF